MDFGDICQEFFFSSKMIMSSDPMNRRRPDTLEVQQMKSQKAELGNPQKKILF
jgi:hypothetical protein